MADENYIDGRNGYIDGDGYIDFYYDSESGEEGLVIVGGEGGLVIGSETYILLDAPKILFSPETPLLTKAQDLAGAINEIYQKRHGNKSAGTTTASTNKAAFSNQDNGGNDNGKQENRISFFQGDS